MQGTRIRGGTAENPKAMTNRLGVNQITFFLPFPSFALYN